MRLPLKTEILRNIILPIGDLVLGQRMIDRLKFLEQAQYWPQGLILTKQKEDLQNLIMIAYNEVPFYRDLFKSAGFKPDDIQNVSDLAKLPIVTKQMLRSGYPHKTTRPTGQKTYEASTSGSTGKNFIIKEDAYTAGWYRASFMLSLEWAGWQIGEPHLQTGITPNRSIERKLKDWMLNCYYVSAYRLDDAQIDHMLNVIERHHLKHLWGYPASLYFLAKRAEQLGWNQKMTSLVTWGDSLYPHYRKMIETVFREKVSDNYGIGEGVQIAAQCENGNYHLHALDSVIEFLDDQGQPVKAGEVGNIVVTRLHPGPMPLIRYVIGDLGVPSNQASCPCGRGFPLMQSIQGRNADVITTPSGNRLIVHFFTGIMEHFPEIDSFQVIQTAPDQILVRILPHANRTSDLAHRVILALKQKGAEDVEIQVEFTDEIPLPSTGKHRFVISHLIKG